MLQFATDCLRRRCAGSALAGTTAVRDISRPGSGLEYTTLVVVEPSAATRTAPRVDGAC